MPTSSPSERESFWLELIERRKTLQLTVREVCDQAGVPQASFFYWQKKLRGTKRRQEHGTAGLRRWCRCGSWMIERTRSRWNFPVAFAYVFRRVARRRLWSGSCAW